MGCTKLLPTSLFVHLWFLQKGNLTTKKANSRRKSVSLMCWKQLHAMILVCSCIALALALALAPANSSRKRKGLSPRWLKQLQTGVLVCFTNLELYKEPRESECKLKERVPSVHWEEEKASINSGVASNCKPVHLFPAVWQRGVSRRGQMDWFTCLQIVNLTQNQLEMHPSRLISLLLCSVCTAGYYSSNLLA